MENPKFSKVDIISTEVVVNAEQAWLATHAARMLRRAGRPYRIAEYYSSIGKVPPPGPDVRLFEDLPLNGRTEVLDVMQAGDGMMEFLAKHDLAVSTLDLLLHGQYAMKIRAEQITGQKITDPRLVTH